MRCRIVLACVCLFAISLGAPGNAHALFITITVDESGRGSLVNPATGTFNLPSSMSTDPGPGGLSSALTYNMLNPPGLVVGDVLISEIGATGAVELSEVIRFNSNGGGTLVFYSDNRDGVDALADVGLPTANYANVVSFLEVGTEGNNGFTYTPGPSDPGFVAGAAFPVTYQIISDVSPVPEPSSLAMLALGGIGLAGWRQWSKRRHATA